MYKSFLPLCLAPLACAQQSYYNVNFDDLYTSSDKQIGVYNDLDYRELRLGRSGVSDSPFQGLQLNSTPNAVYFDGNETNIYAANNGTFHLKRFSAGCVAGGKPTPCNVYIWGYYRDQNKPFNTQGIVYFTPQAGEPTANITRGGLSTWRFYGMGRVNIETVYKEVSPGEGRTIIDDVVYCWDKNTASCWPWEG